MELITTQISMEKKRGAASAQATFDEAYHLPDYLPDLFSVILSDGDIRVDEVKSSPGHVLVRGGIRYRVFYKTDQNEWKIASLDGEIPFQETLAVENMDEFDMVSVKPVLEDLSVRIANSRKLNVRALLDLQAEARQRYDIEIPEGMDVGAENPAEQLIVEREFLELCYQGKENSTVRKEIPVPAGKPNIRQILWQQTQVFGLNCRLSPGAVSAEGEMQVFVIYAGEETDQLQWFAERVPFRCEFEIPEAEGSRIPYIEVRAQNSSCSAGDDEDGEARMVLAETALLADIRLYAEQKRRVLRDAYALDRELVLHKNPVLCSALRMKNESHCRLNDTIRLRDQDGEVLQICAGFGAAEIDRSTFTADGIRLEGVVRICILYLTSSDSSPVEAAEGVLPFSYLIEIPGLLPEDDVKLQHRLEALSFLLKNSREAEVQAVVTLEAMVVSPDETEQISRIEETEQDMEDWRAQPSMVGLTLSPEDSLWQIAKEYRTTAAEIRTLNHLEHDSVPERRKILVVKQRSGKA